jgi:hypothetical protein
MMATLKVTVSGPVGSGKSAVAGEIEIALKSIGLEVSYLDAIAAQTEKNMTHADWQSALLMYEPSIIIEEKISRVAQKPLNHDLLEKARPLLIEETISLIEGCSIMQSVGDNYAPIPGTCSPGIVDAVEKRLQLIRDIESEVGPTQTPIEGWFDDLLNHRWSLTEMAGDQ